MTDRLTSITRGLFFRAFLFFRCGEIGTSHFKKILSVDFDLECLLSCKTQIIDEF